MPGNIRIEWQGVGADSGRAVVHGDAGEGEGWYIVEGVGGLGGVLDLSTGVTSAGTGHTETLSAVFHYPDPWWRGDEWCAFPDDPADPQEWTAVRTGITNWLPREWEYVWLPASAQGATDVSALSSMWYGDEWYRGQAPRGVLRRDGNPPAAMSEYRWPGTWEWYGGGTAPAGKYRRTDGASGGLVVGFWDEESGSYKLTPPHSRPVQADIEMVQLGLLRNPPIDPADPDPQLAPSGWDFEGADWEDPDRFDWRYWYCIRAAILERESVVNCGVDREMGALSEREELMFNMSPYAIPSIESLRSYRSALVALCGWYVDFEKAKRVELSGEYPSLARYAISPDDYPGVAGGWTGSQPVQAASPYGFLKDAYALLRAMVVSVPSRIYHNRYKNVLGGDGYGDTLAEAWTAMSDDYDDSGPWRHWTRSRAEPQSTCWWALDSGIHGRCIGERWGSDVSFAANAGCWWTSIESFCVPPTSVLDGAPMAAPRVLYIRNSRKVEGEVGDDTPYGRVVANTFWSAMGLTEGVYAGTFDTPVAFVESPPQGPPPVDPPDADDDHHDNVHLWGNVTDWIMLLYWGASFRFGGPSPIRPEQPDEP